MSSAVTRIAEQLASRKENASKAYRELVTLTAADGKSPSLDDIERILTDAGKTIEDFAIDEQRCRKRNGWRETISNVPKIKAEIGETKAAIEAEDKKLEAAKAAHAAAVRPLRMTLGAAHDALKDVATARRELNDTMWPDDVKALQRLNARCEAAHREATEAREALLSLKSRMASPSPQRNNYGWLTEAEEAEARNRRPSVKPELIEAAQKRLDDAEEKLSEAMAERDEFIDAATAR